MSRVYLQNLKNMGVVTSSIEQINPSSWDFVHHAQLEAYLDHIKKDIGKNNDVHTFCIVFNALMFGEGPNVVSTLIKRASSSIDEKKDLLALVTHFKQPANVHVVFNDYPWIYNM